MPRLRWSQSATLDVSRLYAFLSPKSREAARRAVQVIQNGIGVLVTHPEVGRLIDGLPTSIRQRVIEFGHGAYVVRYQYDAREIVILAVRHCKEIDF